MNGGLSPGKELVSRRHEEPLPKTPETQGKSEKTI